MSIPEIVLEEKYENNFTNLMKAVKDNDCCAFIGAGLSRPAGYPLWSTLIEHIRIDAEKFCETIDDDDLHLYDKAELYKEILGEDRFLEIILDEFNPHINKQPYNPIHLDLLNIPFVSFITTNYDCILEKAACDNNISLPSNYYPEFPILKIRLKQIFHIHGILDFDRLDETKKSIIITRSDVTEAYKKDSSIQKLLDAIFQELTILFIGFDTTDPFIREIFKDSIHHYEIKNRIALERNGRSLKSLQHFALLPNLVIEEPKEIKFLEPEISREEKIASLTKKDDEVLESFGINPIRYDGDSFNHTQLIELVHRIKMKISGSEDRQIIYDQTFHGE